MCDPLDVLVLMDEPAFPGCVLTCRPIGVIEGEQGDGKSKVRNDRIAFVNYKLSGKEYRVLGLKGADQARKLVKTGMR